MGIFDGMPGFPPADGPGHPAASPPGWNQTPASSDAAPSGDGPSATATAGFMAGHARGGVVTSDFSVRELLVVEHAGFRALGLCMGNSIWKVQANFQLNNSAYELIDITGAMYGAREKAVEIMRAEAEALGADGIVGTRLEIAQLADSGMLEFRAFGTAIVHQAGYSGYRRPDGRPFTSDLSGQDFALALKAGRRPLDLVIGCCVQHIPRRSLLTTLRQTGQCVELDLFTQAYYTAREAAMERMTAHAAASGANEIIGTRLQEDSHVWGDHIVEFLAVGTAMLDTGQPDPDFDIAPTLTLSMDI
ncbi:heavy metal-binding domain-containing protein [Gluconacetobacter aggeris]|uniref:Heavy metal-binding domain-containing protein n=1 Tax=Gluconacetobacter aggeris TaxID=1286186 RepID=A0A7W4IRQ3_9PROT|nr:heavy metal-binding domain-containing protein [Gluconacetobacter aggeris]MBB2167851.1 heavy metal-binding domain-containing protein [Gluconacetobacter aggeris]